MRGEKEVKRALPPFFMNAKVIREKVMNFFDLFICLTFFPYSKRLKSFPKVKSQSDFITRTALLAIAKECTLHGDILEIGSLKGGSSLILALGNKLSEKKSTVWLIEPEPKPNKKVFLDNFKFYGLDNSIKLINKTSEESRKLINPMLKFIFVDGNHEYEFVKKDIMLWKDSLVDNGIIAFHDCEWVGVRKAIKDFVVSSKEFNFVGTTQQIAFFIKGEIKGKYVERLKNLLASRRKFVNFGRKIRILLGINWEG